MFFEKLSIKLNPDSIFLDGELISQVYLDQDSMLWIGTWNNGLFRFDLNYSIINSIPLSSAEFPLRIYTIYEGKRE